MLLDRSNVSDRDRRLIMAANERSVAYGPALGAMCVHFAEDTKSDAYEAREVGGDTQQVFEGYRVDNKLREPPHAPL